MTPAGTADGITPMPPPAGDESAARTAAARRRGDAALAGHLGDEATARALVADADPEVRATALGALVRLAAATVADMNDALADPDRRVRRRACEMAGAVPEARYRTLLDDPEPDVVEAACFAVGEVRDASAVAGLARIASSHEDPLCRESAVAALGAIGDRAGLASVLAALGDRPPVRRRALIALAAFEGPEVDAAVRACLDDRDWQVRQVAEDLLGVSDGDAGQ